MSLLLVHHLIDLIAFAHHREQGTFLYVFAKLRQLRLFLGLSLGADVLTFDLTHNLRELLRVVN